MDIEISAIIVGERRREDLVDIADLAKSIKEHGLIQPIVIDSENRLIAGMRRLTACQALGWTQIDVRRYGALTEQELRILELEENVRRKSLNPYELAKEMVAYAEVVGEQLREDSELLPESGNKPAHRPPKPDSQEKIAERTGIPRQTASEAQTQVDLAEAFPFMQSWPQYRVLEAEEYVAQLPEMEHESICKLLNQPAIPPDSGLQIIKNLSSKTQEERAEIYAFNQSPDQQSRDKALTMAAGLPDMPDPRLQPIRDAIKALQLCIKLSKDEFRELFMDDLQRIRERETALK